jgi:GrpB-like predicted nucleotidyltransferase (UPF0157 family)
LPEPYRIEHVGSTAVVGLGGKGIIDILISVPREKMGEYSSKLREAGYVFSPQACTKDRYFYKQDIETAKYRTRRFHIHLTYPSSQDEQETLAFRDYLRNHPEEVKRYSDIKEEAGALDNVNKKTYWAKKEPVFRDILSKALKE